MSPGAHQKRPGSITVMKNDNSCERAVVLVQQALDLLRRSEDAPASPVNTFMTAKRRRALRREAVRLRQGKAEPRYKNLFSAEELATIYERTVQRDELVERVARDFKRISREMVRIMEENPPGLTKTLRALVLQTLRSAEEQGPGSEAARRFRHVMYLVSLGRERIAQLRRQKTPVAQRLDLAPDPSVQERLQETAAELVTSPPSLGETVIAIPPLGRDSGRERLLLRIGIGKASWIGSFECGHTNASTVSFLPDCKHLFVAAAGAGYVIDAKSRTLVETIGTRVAGTFKNDPLTLYVVDHDGMSLEAFGTTGRLWKTDTISSGGFRRIDLRGDKVVGEARLLTWDGWWAPFSVKIDTGEVKIDVTDVRTE